MRITRLSLILASATALALTAAAPAMASPPLDDLQTHFAGHTASYEEISGTNNDVNLLGGRRDVGAIDDTGSMTDAGHLLKSIDTGQASAGHNALAQDINNAAAGHAGPS